MPVLPLVASISVSPGLMVPRFSAPAIIDTAGRSFTDPAGLLPSSLQRMTMLLFSFSVPGMRCSLTSGVSPTKSSIVLYLAFIDRILAGLDRQTPDDGPWGRN